MKQFLPVVWWLTATLVIAFVLVGLGYLFADALLLGVLFLPGMLTARYFVPQLSFENRRQGILDTVYLALAILGIEYLSLMLGHAVVLGAGEGGMPGLLLNPPFILLVLTALIAPEIALEKHLERRCPYARSISFVSDRRKITLDPAEISYVESNDSEVWRLLASRFTVLFGIEVRSTITLYINLVPSPMTLYNVFRSKSTNLSSRNS